MWKTLHLIMDINRLPEREGDVGLSDNIDILTQFNEVDNEPSPDDKLTESDDTQALEIKEKEDEELAEGDDESSLPEPVNTDEEIQFETVPRRQEILKEFPDLF